MGGGAGNGGNNTAMGAGTTSTTTTTTSAGATTTGTITAAAAEPGLFEPSGRKKLLPSMMMWDAPPLSRRSLMQREPDLPNVGGDGSASTLPLPTSLLRGVIGGGGGVVDNSNNNNTNTEGMGCHLGRGGMIGRGVGVANTIADGEICVGSIRVNPPTTATVRTQQQNHDTGNSNNEEQKREETVAGDHHHVDDHYHRQQHSADTATDDDNSNNTNTSRSLGPYDVAIKCSKCRVILKVHFDVGLVVCPHCRTINPTKDYANNG